MHIIFYQKDRFCLTNALGCLCSSKKNGIEHFWHIQPSLKSINFNFSDYSYLSVISSQVFFSLLKILFEIDQFSFSARSFLSFNYFLLTPLDVTKTFQMLGFNYLFVEQKQEVFPALWLCIIKSNKLETAGCLRMRCEFSDSEKISF